MVVQWWLMVRSAQPFFSQHFPAPPLAADVATTTVPLQSLAHAVGPLGGVEGQAAVVAAAGAWIVLGLHDVRVWAHNS